MLAAADWTAIAKGQPRGGDHLGGVVFHRPGQRRPGWRKAAVRAYGILRKVSGRLQPDVLSGMCRTAGDGRRTLLAPRQPSAYPAWSARDRGPVPAFPLATLW